MLEGSRTFDIAWGATTGTVCMILGAISLALWLRARRTGEPSLFGAAIDPKRRLQFAYAIFAMVMGGTNYGCRFIDHRYLEAVHEGWFVLTVVIVATLGTLLARRVRAVVAPVIAS